MTSREPVNAQKQRTGLSRMAHAFGYSLAGLRAGGSGPSRVHNAW